MNDSGIKEKKQRNENENDVNEFKRKHTFIVSFVVLFTQSDYDTALRVRHDHRLKVDSRNTSYDTDVLYKINKTEETLKESIINKDD